MSKAHRSAPKSPKPARSASEGLPHLRPLWLAAPVVAALAFILYLPTVRYDFLNFDDYDYVVDNGHVNTGLKPSNIAWSITAFASGNWHPLTFISHMVDSEIYGLAPGGHHATNVFFHVGNSVLVLVVFFLMTRSVWPSAAVAAFFAVHPLNVESVAWIAERKNVLSTFFWLLTMGAYWWHSQRPSARRLSLVGLCLALGLAAKPMVVTLPCVLLLLDYWPLKRWQPGRRPWPLVIEKLPLFALCVLSSALTVAAQGKAGALRTLGSIPESRRVMNALVSYVAYLGKMVWPSHLAVFYPHPGGRLSWIAVALATLLLAVITILVLRARRAPYLAVGWFWYLGTLVPVIGIVQVGGQAMADRYAYVPLLGIFVAIAWGVADLAETRPLKRAAAVAGLASVAALSLLTWRQVGFWKDSFTLFTHAAEVTNLNYMAHTNIGLVYIKQKRWDEAIREFDTVLRIMPRWSDALGHMGYALARKGRIEQAITYFENALTLDGRDVHVLNNLAAAVYKRDPDRAIRYLRKAMEIDPEFVDAEVNLGAALLVKGEVEAAREAFGHAVASGSPAKQFQVGSVLLEQGQLADAERYFQAALRGDPRNADAENNLGVVYMRTARQAEALQHFQAALALEPNHADGHSNIGNLMFQKGQTKEAINELEAAIRLNPGHVDARTTLGVLLTRDGHLDTAIGHFRIAVDSDPDNALAQNNLGAALLQKGDFDAAIEHCRKAIKTNPMNADAHSNLGVALLQVGQVAAAIEELRAALKLQPEHKNAMNYLNQALSGKRGRA